ncbi:hypothetical protein BHAOGJBA_4228 [Methylobacterium hispanicum]|uniref:Uncharacterized protein n=1 Tax=Methylobacterium hispanicum TaxID=270350 RepID=A0AAV4ZS39_9HYPH|nr:hypothetical protein [Methylobacterium hispanicum]GJD90686.1 hypothetical protein BHAOGJBA_4228 [Methylobacterium hispanicum]
MNGFAVDAIRRAVLEIGEGRVEVDRFSDAVAVSVYAASKNLHSAFAVRNAAPFGYRPEAMADENVLEVMRHRLTDQPVLIPFEGLGIELVAARTEGFFDVIVRKSDGQEPIHGDTVDLTVFAA